MYRIKKDIQRIKNCTRLNEMHRIYITWQVIFTALYNHKQLIEKSIKSTEHQKLISFYIKIVLT